MKIRNWMWGVSVAGLLTTACVGTQKPPVTTPTEAQVAAATPAIGAFGLDVSGMDTSVKPGDDWYRYANGAWSDGVEIPADRSSYGLIHRLTEQSEQDIREIIEAAIAADAAPGTPERRVADAYRAAMDVERIEALGITPMQPYLDALAAVKDHRELAHLYGQRLRTGIVGPFYLGVMLDAKEKGRYVASVRAVGQMIGARDFYLVDAPFFAGVRDNLVRYYSRLLELTGDSEAEAKVKAERLLALEVAIARVHPSREERRDADLNHNRWAAADFAERAPGFDWAGFFDALEVGDVAHFNVAAPNTLISVAQIYTETPLPVLKDWMRVQLADNLATNLPQAFRDASFDFYGKGMGGQEAPRPRWEVAMSETKLQLNDTLSQLYVERHFRPEAKTSIDALVKNVTAEMDRRLQHLGWMSEGTRAASREKLASFKARIGYPEVWEDESGFEIRADDAFGNGERVGKFFHARNLRKLTHPPTTPEFLASAMTVNAFASPTTNEIIFPAAFLQPPFFDPHADDAVNYGAIGTVIGHEISHHFDDQGRKYDARGELNPWWPEKDVAAFEALAAKLVEQVEHDEPLPGMRVNGQAGLGENIADLAGLLIAYDAYQASLGGKPAPVIDGLTGDQRFFLAFAQNWRFKYRDQILKTQLQAGTHMPSFLRALMVRNVDAWYEAFDVKPGDALYLAPEKRVRIW